MNYTYIKRWQVYFCLLFFSCWEVVLGNSEDSGAKPDMETPDEENADDGENEIPEHNTLLGLLCLWWRFT